MSTGWKKTGGIDSETVMQFQWEVEPTSDYTPADSIFTFLFAQDMHTKSAEVSQFSRNLRELKPLGSDETQKLMLQSYGYVQMTRSMFDLM